MAATNGWLPSYSVAMLLLATARAGSQPAPSAFMQKLLAEHIRVPGLSADTLLLSAREEIEASWQHGGLRAVFATLQEHCVRLADSLVPTQRRRIVDQMLQVTATVSDDPTKEANIRAFPYAAARVWKLDDVAQSIVTPGR